MFYDLFLPPGLLYSGAMRRSFIGNIVILFMILTVLLSGADHVFAQCSGGYTCHYNCPTRCYCNGVTQGDDYPCRDSQPGCSYETRRENCLGQRDIGCGFFPDCEMIPDTQGCQFYSGSCSASGPSCGDGNCDPGETSATCPADCGICPPGFIYCSSCINGCRSASQSCQDHINNECGTGGPAFCETITSQERATECGGYCAGACQRGYWRRDLSAACTPEIQATNPLCSCGTICVFDPTCGSCSAPYCGQANSCGGYCSDTDNGTPGTVNLTPPDGGQVFLNADGTITLSWSAASKADLYRIQLYPQTGSLGCSHPNALCRDQAARTLTYTPRPEDGNRYTLHVQPINTTCDNDYGSVVTSNFTIFTTISGAFYLDTGQDAAFAGDFCTSPTAIPGEAGTGAALGIEGEYSSYQGVIAGAIPGVAQPYQVDAPWWPPLANNIVTLAPGVTGTGMPYVCTCPVGCQYSGIPAPQANLNFYLIDLDLSNAGWWQVQNANVMAEATTGTALLTQVPYDTCTEDLTCTPAMIAQDIVGKPDSAGIAITGGGRIDTTDETGYQTGYVTERTPQVFATGTQAHIRENYDHFYRRYSMGRNPSDDFTGTASDARKPSHPPVNGRAYFHAGDMTIQSSWLIQAGEQFVVFVDGNLTLSDLTGVEQLIQVEPGGFLAFIVSGDITVASSIGNSNLDDTTANIEGVFIADGVLTVQSRGEAAGGDDRFVGTGTFVGWSGVQLQRDFSDGATRKAENNTRPVELFVYRPDFVLNAPERMKTPRYIWQETN